MLELAYGAITLLIQGGIFYKVGRLEAEIDNIKKVLNGGNYGKKTS